jgi:hypothetical protein
LNDIHRKDDIETILVKETELDNVINCSLLIGGMTIVDLDKNMIMDFCDRYIMENDVYVNLFSKFIVQIPMNSCCYNSVSVRFSYDEYDTQVSHVITKVFKYENYDPQYDEDIGYSPDAFKEVVTLKYHGYTPEIKLIPSKNKCKDMVSCLQKHCYVNEPYDLSVSRYLIFDAQKSNMDITITIDNVSFTIKQQDLFYLTSANQYMWKVPYNSETGFVRVEGEKLTSSVPIVYSLNANTLRVTDGMAGVVFAR